MDRILLLTVEIRLPVRVLWAALRRADAWFEDRLDAFDDGFSLGASTQELQADDVLRERMVTLIGTTPGMADLLRERLDGTPFSAFAGLQLVFLQDDAVAPGQAEPAESVGLAQRLLVS